MRLYLVGDIVDLLEGFQAFEKGSFLSVVVPYNVVEGSSIPECYLQRKQVSVRTYGQCSSI